MKRVQNTSKDRKQSRRGEKVTYVKKNWQLYLFFLNAGTFTDNYF